MSVWYVKGDDEALVRERVRELVHELADDPLGVEDFSGEDYEVGAVVDACRTPPFLGARRVVVARGVNRFKADELRALVDWLADPLPTTALVLTGDGQLSRALLTAVQRVGRVVEAGPGSGGRARAGWLAARLRSADVSLDREAAELLMEHLGEDAGRVGGILDALVAAYGEGATVGVAELEPFLGEAGAVAPWDLTDAIDRGDTPAALTHLHRLLDAGDRHPLVVMATLHRHYAAMLRLDGARVADEAGAAALLGIGAFPARKALAQGRRLGSAGVARAITLLADADVDLRGARGWPERLVLEVLVARLSRLVPGGARGARRR